MRQGYWLLLIERYFDYMFLNERIGIVIVDRDSDSAMSRLKEFVNNDILN
ncbi:hypothetical protein [Desulfosporosinus youngiae]|uniref:Uncharacterized protein n=1 Tax=Desulfosporosinus youngiae DSM 17734 TaxID=768710 RepID=H5XT01_9FIRM|nr:hypothetical protein [Desulfosporosinus youngiae]EHQ87964.1 hypothetical protein DesyoDRAFT_0789 [Desulfosporosinus youngiae DSM 17734]